MRPRFSFDTKGKRLLFIFSLLLIFGCAENSETKISAVKDSLTNFIEKEQVFIDTILNIEDPFTMDSTRHNLFIDTSKTSEFYREIQNWDPTIRRDSYQQYYVSTSTNCELKHLKNLKLPSTWVSLEKLKDEFILYNRNDGQPPRIVIADSLIIFNGVWESDIDGIKKINSNMENYLSLEVCTIPEKSEDRKGFFYIKKTKEKYVYLIECQYKDWSYITLATPLKDINKFNMVVNYSPGRKFTEYNKFDEIHYEEYK